MLIVALRLLVFAGIAFAIYRAVRTDPLLKIPAEWQVEAGKDPVVGAAVKLRQSMARVLVKGRAAHASTLLEDVDGVLERLVEMTGMARTLKEESQAIGGEALERVQPSLDKIAKDADQALGWLQEAHGVLLEAAAAEMDGKVGELHGSMQAHAEELRQAVEANREVNQAVREAQR